LFDRAEVPRASSQEECGGPWKYMRLQKRSSSFFITNRVFKILQMIIDFGEEKPRYRLGLISACLQQISETVISLNMLLMNMEKILQDFLSFYFQENTNINSV